jgi:CDP-glucose 4,6-dehydratase
LRGEAFNFSPESPSTVLELVRLIQQLMSCEHLEPVIQNTAQGEIRDQYLSSAKAKEILGWTPQFSPQQGLEETIKWYRRYFSDAHVRAPARTLAAARGERGMAP